MLVMWLVPIGGLVVIAFTLRETFQDLFQPSASGSLSAWIGRATFSVSKRIRFLLPSAGALAILFTIVSWSTLVAIGFAMVFWPNVPDGFNMQTSIHRDAISRFGIAVFLLFRYAGNSRSRRHDAKHKLDPCIVRRRGVIRILFANG